MNSAKRVSPEFWARIVVPVLLACLAGAPSTQSAGAIYLQDTAGAVHEPLVLDAGERAAVFIFVAAECPVCNAYSSEINRIDKEYEAKGVRVFLVQTESDMTVGTAAQHAREFGLSCTILLDPNRVLVRRLGARVTPEAVVVDGGAQVLYQGRIDNLYVGLGKRRFEATTHELRDALDAVDAGKAVTVASAPAVGCVIESGVIESSERAEQK